jgi:hypothetical protein
MYSSRELTSEQGGIKNPQVKVIMAPPKNKIEEKERKEQSSGRVNLGSGGQYLWIHIVLNWPAAFTHSSTIPQKSSNGTWSQLINPEEFAIMGN